MPNIVAREQQNGASGSDRAERASMPNLSAHQTHNGKTLLIPAPLQYESKVKAAQTPAETRESIHSAPGALGHAAAPSTGRTAEPIRTRHRRERVFNGRFVDFESCSNMRYTRPVDEDSHSSSHMDSEACDDNTDNGESSSEGSPRIRDSMNDALFSEEDLSPSRQGIAQLGVVIPSHSTTTISSSCGSYLQIDDQRTRRTTIAPSPLLPTTPALSITPSGYGADQESFTEYDYDQSRSASTEEPQVTIVDFLSENPEPQDRYDLDNASLDLKTPVVKLKSAKQAVGQSPPSAYTIQAARDMSVFDETGTEYKFGHIIDGTIDGNERQIIVFLRHYFCLVSSLLTAIQTHQLTHC